MQIQVWGAIISTFSAFERFHLGEAAWTSFPVLSSWPKGGCKASFQSLPLTLLLPPSRTSSRWKPMFCSIQPWFLIANNDDWFLWLIKIEMARDTLRVVTTAGDDDEVIITETYVWRKVARHFITVATRTHQRFSNSRPPTTSAFAGNFSEVSVENFLQVFHDRYLWRHWRMRFRSHPLKAPFTWLLPL